MAVSLRETLTIILGGGKGTRLYPLTKERCKPAAPLGGKYRLIDAPISNSINSGLRRIYVVTQFLSSSLNQHIARAYSMDHFSRGFVSILAAAQRETGGGEDWFQGTADAVRKALAAINKHEYKRIVILSGDQLYKMDYRAMIDTHERADADITISVLPVAREKVAGFGVMRIDDSGRIVEFVEKSTDPETIERLKVSEQFRSERFDSEIDPEKSWLASMGIYVFEIDKLLEILSDMNKVDFGKDVIPSALASYKTQAHIFSGYWEDIGAIKDFFEANIALGEPNPRFVFDDPVGGRIYTSRRFLTATRIGGANISRSIVSDGCVIGDKTKIDRSVIGIRSRIGSDASIEECIVMGADFTERPTRDPRPNPGIGDGASIRRAILDKNVTIGADAKIVNKDNRADFDSETFFIRDGIVIVPKNVAIDPGQVI